MCPPVASGTSNLSLYFSSSFNLNTKGRDTLGTSCLLLHTLPSPYSHIISLFPAKFSKTMTTFTRFIELPRELRDQIWSLAIRDDHPGAHIFGQYVTGSHGFQSWRGLSFDVAAPSWGRYFESLDENRSDENISTYLIDGGLWTACHESRCIMEDHFRQSGRQLAPRHPNDRRSSFSEKDLFKMASSGYFNGNPLEIVTVFPYRDLFIVQHEDLDKIDWGYLGFGFCGVGHIAIEYDQAWVDGLHTDEVVNSLFLKACAEANYTLWFIDRSLKRKSQAPIF
ncbi:uncharacterized protein FFUJ_12541 [Fusarium fujikuroi IMI 58289]|uniref:2EXR domain-containing protein n=1 Tax=Gibberella fujikuroi (strain CBS 195.34 / IMI 58289 / NRRL A-6831) TaxID=1279085 RepID=S0ECH7_GIBF5|nr:uncharacterized protein FFUJ_12541 [Fusarium fujikuroi IMI 58289]SCO15925.1 uncharacterized protein FFE2_13489 [Fusarium fujikuroi]CCT72656.1 uncharacterized protein FFUJ_12541 [Fusarium fujikuroi IMI 58289]SCO22720.1 uncharacterized protein FFM5_13081 [Fusarium fujikuroi]SCO39775.1 uncharacterized protein FFNC_07101 [Fusarium fujikuroi]SCV58515.1 uncharacterized protein FFFS_13247 [Fusarium fujikuroi]